MKNTISIDLGLSDIEVTEVKTDKNGNYHIKICSTSTTGKCHICGNKIDKLHEYDREITIRHLPILGCECYLHIKLPRFKCDNCPKKPTTTQQLSWRNYKSRYTKDYEKHILKALINSTKSDVCRKENIGEGCVLRILESYYSDEVDWKEFDSLGQIGIDEIALKKGHKDFVTIITSRMDKDIRILAVLKDRKKATVLEFFKSIPKQLRDTVISVCSDLYEGFINAAKEAFGKRIRVVIDRFHLAKLYRKNVDTVRKQEMKRLKQILSKTDYAKLKGVMWALRKAKSKLSQKEKDLLDKVFAYSPKLEEAYSLSTQLTELLDKETTRNGGIRRLKNWMLKVEKSSTTCFKTFLATLGKWMNEIANYFVLRESSGFVEGFNNRIKVLKRRCYGIVNRKHLFGRISLDIGNHHLSPILVNG